MIKQPEIMAANPKHLGAIHTLQFNHVSFKHQTAMHKAIDDISFKVEKGETIAFVGPSGSGKTTLMKLLVGFTGLSKEISFIMGSMRIIFNLMISGTRLVLLRRILNYSAVL